MRGLDDVSDSGNKGQTGVRQQEIVHLEGQSSSALSAPKPKPRAGEVNRVGNYQGKHLSSNESKWNSIHDLMYRYVDIVTPWQNDQRNPKRFAEYWIDRRGDPKLSRLSPAVLVEARAELAKDKAPSTVRENHAPQPFVHGVSG